MERTPSGNAIISTSTFEPRHSNTLTYGDSEAACRVESHFQRRPRYGKHERILRDLIDNRDDLDDHALESILIACDTLFFGGALRGRIKWEWSHPSQPRYQTELIGTTALRPASQGGFETLIVLSHPILRESGYDRRLLLSAFLHELVHAYLFISCGFDARYRGGHTNGFHDILLIIEEWVGHGHLKLCNMRADLNHFRIDLPPRQSDPRLEWFPDERHSHEGCNQSPRPEINHLEELGMVRNARANGYF